MKNYRLGRTLANLDKNNFSKLDSKYSPYLQKSAPITIGMVISYIYYLY